MWAVLNKKNIVIGVVLPNTPKSEVEKINKNYQLIAMTNENSPATIGDEYVNGKFINAEG
jgi:hypothetical protein